MKETDHFENPGVDGRIIFGWIIEKWVGKLIGFIWLSTGTSSSLL